MDFSLPWLQNLLLKPHTKIESQNIVKLPDTIYRASASHVSHKGICLAFGVTMGDLPYSRISQKSALNAVNVAPARGVIGLELQESGERSKVLVRGAAWVAVRGKSGEGAASRTEGVLFSPQRATYLILLSGCRYRIFQVLKLTAIIIYGIFRSTSLDNTVRHAATMVVY